MELHIHRKQMMRAERRTEKVCVSHTCTVHSARRRVAVLEWRVCNCALGQTCCFINKFINSRTAISEYMRCARAAQGTEISARCEGLAGPPRVVKYECARVCRPHTDASAWIAAKKRQRPCGTRTGFRLAQWNYESR